MFSFKRWTFLLFLTISSPRCANLGFSLAENDQGSLSKVPEKRVKMLNIVAFPDLPLPSVQTGQGSGFHLEFESVVLKWAVNSTRFGKAVPNSS